MMYKADYKHVLKLLDRYQYGESYTLVDGFILHNCPEFAESIGYDIKNNIEKTIIYIKEKSYLMVT